MLVVKDSRYEFHWLRKEHWLLFGIDLQPVVRQVCVQFNHSRQEISHWQRVFSLKTTLTWVQLNFLQIETESFFINMFEKGY